MRERVEMERKAETGFTLLEVIIAIAILMFGILAVASMQTSSIRGNALSMSMTEGTTWAADQAEKLSKLPYKHADLASGAHPSIQQERYTISWTVTDNSPITDVKTVLVTVNWTEHGVAQSITLPRVVPRII